MLPFILAFLMGSSALAQSFYETLGVLPEASHAEIKTAWKKLVIKNHPDRFITNPQGAALATERLSLINAAESVLGDPDFRVYYDYFTSAGKNHKRWSTVSGRGSVEDMAKVYGPADKYILKPKSPHSEDKASASASPSPSPSPAPKKSEDPKKTESQEAHSTAGTASERDRIIEFFRTHTSADEKWRTTYNYYLKDLPPETESSAQIALLKLLDIPMDNWKLDALAEAAILKIESPSDVVATKMKQLLSTKDPVYLRVVLVLVQHAIQHRQTQSFFSIDQTTAENYLVQNAKHPAVEVRIQAKISLEKLHLQVKAYPAMRDILLLDSADKNERALAAQRLFEAPDVGEAELKLLVKKLLKCVEVYNRDLNPLIFRDIITLLDIIDRAHDLSPIYEELADFSKRALREEHKQIAAPILKRALMQKFGLASCRSIFR